jgi:hypothetical protein
MSAGPAVAAVAEKSAAGTGAARDAGRGTRAACRVPRAACRVPRACLAWLLAGPVPAGYLQHTTT